MEPRRYPRRDSPAPKRPYGTRAYKWPPPPQKYKRWGRKPKRRKTLPGSSPSSYVIKQEPKGNFKYPKKSISKTKRRRAKKRRIEQMSPYVPEDFQTPRRSQRFGTFLMEKGFNALKLIAQYPHLAAAASQIPAVTRSLYNVYGPGGRAYSTPTYQPISQRYSPFQSQPLQIQSRALPYPTKVPTRKIPTRRAYTAPKPLASRSSLRLGILRKRHRLAREAEEEARHARNWARRTRTIASEKYENSIKCQCK